MLPHDFDLRASHLQALASRDAIVALFAQLGYNTEARLKQTPAAMGFSEVLAHEVTHIERIAEHDDGELQVYLLEMKRVTVALTQALARSLRNRAGNFLIVLTADYERIDFVLMDLVRPESDSTGIGMRQAYLRPRVLTVNRRNPTPVDLRVLRRFSYTEVDPYYQLDKLRSAYGVAEWSEPFFNNRALFADYYLNKRLPSLSEWQHDPAPAFRTLTKLMADARQSFARLPEDKLRSELYEPLFKALGWTFKALKGGSEDDARPDYMLSTGRNGNVPCLVYVWDRYLDGPDETRDTETPRENPAQTVVGLLDQDEGSGWAIVTNGKMWRLYSARAHSRATNYYEIDLEETLASPDVDQAFRYFWLFFRPSPPAPLPGREKGGFLDFLLDESAQYAKALGERLKDRVFGEIFPHFAEGFIRHWRAEQLSEDDLSAGFQATLTFLYRLLFLLYAEARDLLPARETRGYWEVSLQRLKEEVARTAGDVYDEVEDRLAKAYSTSDTRLYDRLLRLFRAIDLGDVSLNVPTYNGGLFITFDAKGAASPDDSPEVRHARFLHEHKIPDRFLALGLDRLARDIDDKTQALAPIDYKSLGVRQLGSIYEGLLEFRLRVAPAKMAVVRGKKAEEIVPYAEAKKKGLKIKTEGRGASKTDVTLRKGTVYLENDRHERKATGSYYTPDYIVKYIVQHTVGPVLDEKLEALRPRLRQAAKRFHDSVQRKQAIEKVAPDRPALLNDIASDVLRDLFDVKVLDPAMGSGHFLVEAVDFTTDRLLRLLNGFPFIAYFFEGQRRTILAEMARQDLSIDPARLTDINLLKRHVLKRCVFGVDLNPMAVELAKVSLWLDCFTLGAPLSFLDHHLKCGNSLIGARVDEVRDAVEFKDKEQISMFASSQFTGIMLATDLMRRVGELPDTTAEQVAASRAEFRRANDALAPYKRIMDVYISRWFGNDLTPGPSPTRRGKQPLPPTRGKTGKGVEPTVEFLRRSETKAWLDDPMKGLKALDPAMKSVAEIALNAAQNKRFFHWELEFPEVFFGPAQGTTQAIGLKESGGFDAVVGNPPWGGALDRSALSYLHENYEGVNDYESYQYFSELSASVLRRGAFHSFIVPNTYVLNVLAAPFRRRMLMNGSFGHLLDCSDVQLFEDPSVRCIVYIYNGVSADNLILVKKLKPRGGDLVAETWCTARKSEVIDGQPWTTILRDALNVPDLTLRIDKISASLGTLTKSKQGYIPYRLTTLEARFGEKQGRVIRNTRAWHSAVQKDETYVQELQGGDVFRFVLDWSGTWVSYGDWVSSYVDMGFFTGPRLLFREITDPPPHRLLATYTSDTFVHNPSVLNACFADEEYSPLYCLSLVNSSLLSEFFFRTSPKSDKGLFPKVLVEDVRKLPIRRITFTTPAKRRAELAEKGHKLYARCLADNTYTPILTFVEERLSAQPEESDVVHDLLAFLAEQMIDLNKQKQAEQKRFLGWLAGVLKVKPDKKGNTGLDALTGKTTLRGYLGDYQKGEEAASFEAIVDVLHKNRNRLGVSLSDARFTARLKSEFEKSLAVLLPIKDQLARTDGLIDQVVYRLYGLTEEEIAVVEGKAVA